MTQKRKMSMLMVLALVVILAISTVAYGAPAKKIRVSSGGSTTHPITISLYIFKDYVEEHTGGKLSVAIYPNSQLGGERETVEQVQQGSLELATSAIGPVTSFNRKLMVLDIPFCFDSDYAAQMALSSPTGQKMLDTCEEVGLKVLANMDCGFRHVTSSVKPIRKLEDFKNLKFRTMEAPMHMEAFRLLGANPTPVPWTELYLALQQRIADGQENPITHLWDFRLYEVQKYVSLTGHIFDSTLLVTNLKWFNSLSPEHRGIVEKGMLLAQSYCRALNSSREKLAIELLTAKGIEVNSISPEERQRMRNAAQPGVISAIEKEVGKEIVREWMKAVEESNKLSTNY